MFTELTSVSILSFKTSLDCDQILHIKAAKTVFHQKLCGNTGLIHQCSGKGAVVPLLYPAAGTAGLQNNQIRLQAFCKLETLCCARAEFRIYDSPVFCNDQAIPDLRRDTRRRKATHLFRTDRDHLVVCHQLQNYFISIVSTVIFTVSACQTGTDHDFHFSLFIFFICGSLQLLQLLFTSSFFTSFFFTSFFFTTPFFIFHPF